MGQAAEYRRTLLALDDWDPYLLANSGLPGPRCNLELAQVVADEGSRGTLLRYASYTADRAPADSPYEFLAFCGVAGLGRLIVEGEMGALESLRRLASDPRWRIREAVAMALQRLGDADMDRLIAAMRDWSNGSHLEQRAAAAATCEPRLLVEAQHARAVLHLLDAITASVERAVERREVSFLVLRQGLGYCWSVAVVALPVEGKVLMEKWMVQPDRDVQWIMRENLKKARLSRMDAEWAREWQARLGRRPTGGSSGR